MDGDNILAEESERLFYVGKMDSRGRIVLRKHFRDRMGLTHGGRVSLYINQDGALAIAPAEREND
ncbi:hypothetical protein [Blastomonas sp.]|uniref:hypothetical protein n=1 Tax=Blastomonas sp. TaxID=1909299 RepID=UPI00406A832C